MRKLRLNQTLMSVPGHLRPTHSAPVPTTDPFSARADLCPLLLQ
jgi:hypothetical protein